MTLTYGRIVGKFLAAITDGADVGDEPDLVSLRGTITFDLNVDKVIDTAGPTVVAKTAFKAILDSDGNLCTPTTDGVAGALGLTVLATDGATNPSTLQYRVSYALQTPAGMAVSLTPHTVAVPSAGSTVDLALVIPPDNAPPIGLAAAEAAAAAAALSAANATADPEAITDAVNDYLAANPPSGATDGAVAGFISDEDSDSHAAVLALVGDGTPGADGADGDDGADGADGESAYELAVVGGFSGDQAAWLASLKGADGADGDDGTAATITVGTVTTGAAGSSATVTNSGTSSAAVLDFTIPQGAKGDDGTGEGGGAVDSVNGQTGTVVLTATDVDALPDTYTPAWGEVTGKPAFGTAAAADSSTFATAAQGAKADSATQPGDLGTAASEDATAFATAVQGAKADSAVQPAALAGYVPTARTVAGKALTGDVSLDAADVGARADDWNPSYNDLDDKPTLGTAAAAATTDFATAAQGVLADTAVQPDDLAAVATTGSYNDLSDKPASTPTAWEDVTGKPSTFPPVIGTGATDALAGDTEIPSTAADVGAVPTTRTVNSKPLSADVTLSASDVGAYVKPGPGVPATDLATAVQTSLGKADTALQAADLLVAVTAVTANYTLVLTDGGKAVEMSNSSARTITVPPNSSVAFPIGTVIECARMGAGAVTIAAGAGVTIRNAAAVLTLRAQYSVVSLRKRATNEWVIAGDLG